jgi:hypothetical protein
MKLINSFKAIRKQSDKFEFVLRVSKLTVFEISIDLSSSVYKLIICNLGIQL